MRKPTSPVDVDRVAGPVTAAVAAATSALVVLATVTVAAVAGQGADPAAFRERELAPVAIILLVVAVALVPVAVLTLGARPREAVGLALAGVATCAPLWAAWTSLPPGGRASFLAAGTLAVGGLALVARSIAGLLLAAAATLLHALTYDPFRDIGCARVCLEVPSRLEMSTADLTRVVVVLVLAAAALTVVAAARTATLAAWSAALGAALLAVLAVVRWRTVGDPDAFGVVLLAATAVPALVAAPRLVMWVRQARERRAVRRLVDALSTEPDRLRTLAGDLDPNALTPGQLLAWRNAELLAVAQVQVAEVRASQRRVVAAADAERHRIERDLHDGAQQRLVGVLMQLSGSGLETVEANVRRVLGDLRSLGDRGFPRVLDEEGLGPALEELAATSNARVRLDLPLTLEVTAEQARAVYALVAATATAGEVTVTIAEHEGGLHVLLRDAPHDPPEQVRDRVRALAGRLDVHGREIRGVLPCGW